MKISFEEFKEKSQHYLRTGLRDQLSEAKTSVPLCALALVFALIASGVILMLRVMLSWSHELTAANEQDFTEITADWRVFLPLLAAILIRVAIKLGSGRYKRLGIAYVLHMFKMHYGKLPLPSALAQFFQAFFALAGYFSVGREGPAIHLGAVTASVLAKHFKLPDNSVRIMCASGIAAGIAATFNTPLAAVIFVFEVIVREYKIHYFFPIMLSAICGALSSQLVFGDVHEYDHIEVLAITLDQYPLLAIAGLALGCAAAAFNHTLILVTEKSVNRSLTLRLLLAGTITTAIGLVMPQALGTGNWAIEAALNQHPTVLFLLALLLAKVIATIAAIGLGVPGGLIGPLYGIGAIVGTLIGMLCAQLFPALSPYIGLYAVIGMTAMMGVTLNAPLAGLVALLELTNDTNIILPAMFVTVLAFLVSYRGFRSQSIFLRQLDIMGLEYRVPAINAALQKTGVRALMNRRMVVVNNDESLLLEVLKRAQGRPVLVRNEQGRFEKLKLEMQSFEGDETLYRLPMQGLPDTATLNEAYELLLPRRSGEVFIWQDTPDNLVGVISWANLQQEIRSGKL
ncbi:MAG: chloride channel protein [Shewanella sp.]|nr:chloride channel protein [Shewanella sp.]MCF1432086.1 chloride channel protein [Shewanella sp.]MCF1439876.1 chloride channel protein [Shewanella sp.]MCF1457290.1 chloride channel protein [Shewanella sp.]